MKNPNPNPVSCPLEFRTTKIPILCLSPKHCPSFSMSMAATFPGGGSSFTAAAAKKPFSVPNLPSRFSSTNYSACRCTDDNRTIPFQAWVGARTAWYYTVVGPERAVTAAEAPAVEGLRGPDKEDEENFEKGQRGEKDSEQKAVRLHRRRKGSTDLVGDVDLLTIPGVGPKNLRKLVEKGFREMAELKQFYKDKFLGKANEAMVEYLQRSVGIIHRNHAESIANFIKESVGNS